MDLLCKAICPWKSECDIYKRIKTLWKHVTADYSCKHFFNGPFVGHCGSLGPTKWPTKITVALKVALVTVAHKVALFTVAHKGQWFPIWTTLGTTDLDWLFRNHWIRETAHFSVCTVVFVHLRKFYAIKASSKIFILSWKYRLFYFYF